MSALLLQFPKTAQSAPKAAKVRSPKPPKSDRLYLTESEIEKLMTAAGKTRHPTRNRALVWLAYRHGFRSIELLNLQWEAVDFESQQLHCWRAKRGKVSIHPLMGRELRLLRALKVENPHGRYIFLSERGAPLSGRGLRRLVAELGKLAGLKFTAHPHQLRHACGHALANQGQDTRAIQDYLGHRNISHTVRYTALAADRFKRFWNGN